MKNNRKNRKRVKMQVKRNPNMISFIEKGKLYLVPKWIYAYLQK